MELNLGFLASHNGSNVRAILDAISRKELDAHAKVIISNNHDAHVLELARERNIPFCYLSSGTTECPDKAMLNVLKKHDVNLVVLAGYMKKIGREVLNAYPNRILNIHPSLLPKYGGKGMYGIRVHEAVIASDDCESGATVHLVNPEYDEGVILSQYSVPRYKSDTAETLAERVLNIEHVLYPQVLKEIQDGIIKLD